MLKKRKGFTLFEAIISVGIITVSSITILQIFYTSGNLNRRASDIDMGNSILTQAFEITSSVTERELLFTDEIFKEAVEVEIENPLVSRSIAIYYDKNWETIPTTGDVPDNTKFIIRYDVIEETIYKLDESIKKFTLGPSGTDVEYISNEGLFYTIDATITSVGSNLVSNTVGDLSSPILTSLSSGKFIEDALD